MYHACDSFQDYDPALCVMKLDVLAVADFYGSLYSFWVTLLAVAELNESLKSVCYAGGALFLTVAIQTDRFSVWDFGVPVITGSIIIVLSWVNASYVTYKLNRIMHSPRFICTRTNQSKYCDSKIPMHIFCTVHDIWF